MIIFLQISRRNPHAQVPYCPPYRGGLAILIVLLSLLSCSESTKHDETVSVTVKDEIVTKSLTTTVGEYDTSLSSDDLYWTYTAVKKDGYFTTGQQTTAVPLNYADDDTTPSKGIPTGSIGSFSKGEWLFSFWAYESVTDSDGNESYSFTDDYLYYTALDEDDAETVTLSESSSTITASVQLYEAVRNGGGYGWLNIHDLLLKNDADDPDEDAVSFSSSFSAWVQIGNDDLVQVATYTTEDDGASWNLYGVDIMNLVDEDDETSYTSDELATGYYDVAVYIASADETIIGYGTSDEVLVRANLTTEVTGSVDSDLTEVSVGDVDVSFGSVTVSSVSELESALTDSQISEVVLSESLEITSYLTITSDATIDLNGTTVTATSTHGLVVYEDGATLTLTDSSEDGSGSIDADYYPVYVAGDNTTITIEGGSYTSDGYTVIYVQGDDACITINDGDFDGGSCIAYSSSSSSPDLDVTINGGTFTADVAAINLGTTNLGSADITITGGTFSGDYYAINVNGNLTSSNNVTISISGGTFTNEVFLAGYTTTVISGGTFTGADGMQALHVKAGDITITGGTFNHADYGTESYTAPLYDYFKTGSGSMSHDEAIVIEANSNYRPLSSVTLTSGLTANTGILLAIDPDYDLETNGDVKTSIDEALGCQQYTVEDMIYKRAVSGVGTAYFTSLDNAKSFTSFAYGTPGDLYVYSDSGWAVYSEYTI